jgi:hypothetical protein
MRARRELTECLFKVPQGRGFPAAGNGPLPRGSPEAFVLEQTIEGLQNFLRDNKQSRRT